MGKPSLEGVDLKLNRAKDRLDALSKAIGEFLTDPDSYSLALKCGPQRREAFRVTEVRSPPPDWGILIGDCVHHYRSALDHLVFQLVVANTRGRLPAKVEKRSEFPIFNSGPKFRGKGKRKGVPSSGGGLAKIQDTPAAAQAIIESLQPYHRRKKPAAQALWELQELANIDKHRLLHVTYATIRGSTFTVTQQRNVASLRGFRFRPGPLKPNAVIAEWQVIPIDPRHGTKMNVESDMLTDIIFGKASPARAVRGKAVVKTLYEIGTFIAGDVLPPLTSLLGLASTFTPGRLIDLEPLSVEEKESLGERVLTQELTA